jgi:hypothetical protein
MTQFSRPPEPATSISSVPSSWHDYGEGFGAKSTSLRQIEGTLIELGASIPNTARYGISLTNRILDFLRDRGLEVVSNVAGDIEDGIGRELPDDIKQGILEAVAHVGDQKFIAVRSDPYGDDTGVGVYESYLIDGSDRDSVFDAVVKVVASHNTPEARQFRAEHGYADGIAVMFQAVCGELFETADMRGEKMTAFAPAWSLIVQVGARIQAMAVPGLGNPMDPSLLEKQLAFTGSFFQSTSGQFSKTLLGLGLPEGRIIDRPVEIAIPDHVSKILGKTTSRVNALISGLAPAGRQYAEACIGWDGRISVVQYGRVSIPAISFPDTATIENGFMEGRNPMGAVSLTDAGVLFYRNRRDLLEADAINQFLEAQGVSGRTVALIADPSHLRMLTRDPKCLWGAFRHIGAILSPTGQGAHRSHVENHFTGAVRKAGIGFCETGDLPIGPQSFGAVHSEDGKFAYVPRCFDIFIDEHRMALVRGRLRGEV